MAITAIGLALAVSCGRAAKKPLTLDEQAAEINALIPPKWKDKILFVPGTITFKDWKYSLLLPKGWVDSPLAGTVVPPDNNIVDFSPTFGYNNEVSTVALCGGDCGGVKDWKAASEKQLFSQFTTGLIRGKALSDQPMENGRLMIYQRSPEKGNDVKVVPGDKARLVIRAWWDPKEERYHHCQITLSDLSFELAPVMAAVCMTATAERIAAPPPPAAAPASPPPPKS